MKKNLLIGLSGKARSGKDTVGKYLQNKLLVNTYALAEPIKSTVNNMFGWDDRHSDGDLKEIIDPNWGFSPRQAYQLFGTEFGRALRGDMWIHMASIKLASAGSLIVTDIRFENEALWIRENNGILIHINRFQSSSVAAHSSEGGIEYRPGDHVIYNDSTIDHLYSSVEILCANIGITS